MKKYAIIDQQSQLLNRVYFDDHYEGKETNQSFAIINIDLFKNYEILYGYTITNKIMIEMSQLILNRLKDIGLVFRYNSDQFYVLFQETEGDVCHKRIHLLKDEIDNFDLSIENNSIHLTVSIGLILNQNWTLMEQLILDGQQALFQSKILGRNKITIA
jgi:diguanylate cyclase (GGDEF)-like protein